MDDSAKPLESLLDKVDESIVGAETDLKSVVESLGDRAFGPVLALSGLIMVTPLGAIPGMPIALAAVIISFSLQLLLGRETPWLPQTLRRIRFKQKSITSARERVEPILSFIDGAVRPRLPWASHIYVRKLAAVFAIFIALLLIPLGAVPFGVAIPGLVLTLIGLGILARDGLLLLAAFTILPIIISLILAFIA